MCSPASTGTTSRSWAARPTAKSLIRQLLNHFAGLDLSDANLRDGQVDAGNVLGDAYEYLIYNFAERRGEEGAASSTLPSEVVRLIVELAGAPGADAHLRPHRRVMRDADLRRPVRAGAGRRHPQPRAARAGAQPGHPGHRQAEPAAPRSAVGAAGGGRRHRRARAGGLGRDGCFSYDRVIANPPFSLKNWGHEFAPGDPNHRFDRYGAIPPKTRGDLAFLLHMLAVTNAQGRVGVVMPHGVLFRGGAEGKIRRGIVEADLFEAVIGLAPNLFFGASIPVAICVLNRDKSADRRGKVLFVDAAQPGYYRAERAQNFLDREHITSIVAAYRAFEYVERFAHVADLAEIEGNDFNLNISRYVDTTEPVETLSVAEALAQLREAERRRDEATARMDALLAELGYSR